MKKILPPYIYIYIVIYKKYSTEITQIKEYIEMRYFLLIIL